MNKVYKSYRDYTDDEIYKLFKRALDDIRQSMTQYGKITITVSAGKVKYMTVERSLESAEKAD